MNELEEFGKSVPSKTVSKPESISLDQKDEEKKEPHGRCQWASHGPKTSIACGRTYSDLCAGVYGVSSHQGEPIFVERDINVDGLLEFPDSQADTILSEIDGFWGRGETFKKYGYLHRRGYLLFGPPGSGKTAIVQQVIQRIVRAKGLVLICGHPRLFAEALGVLRQVEPNRRIVCIYEDIDAIVQDYGEDALLSVLDGESQIDKVLNIATTNYPERLDKRIIARPRRFDRVLKVGMPNPAVRRAYFKSKLLIDNSQNSEELEQWVKETQDFSFAAMAELVISVKCLGNPFPKALDLLRKLMVNKVSSGDFEQKMGFGA